MHEFSFPLKKLWFTHVFIIVLSNYAVQIPLTLAGVHTTLGTFTYPFIFLTTDLTVRLYGQRRARVIILLALLPALVLSYIVGVLCEHGSFRGFSSLAVPSVFVFRISLASLSAYLLGQLADILVFQKLRRLRAWWPAPASSSVCGNLLDTYVFFAVAFMGTTDAFMAEHWLQLAGADYLVKLAANLAIFVPIYGLVLGYARRLLLGGSPGQTG